MYRKSYCSTTSYLFHSHEQYTKSLQTTINKCLIKLFRELRTTVVTVLGYQLILLTSLFLPALRNLESLLGKVCEICILNANVRSIRKHLIHLNFCLLVLRNNQTFVSLRLGQLIRRKLGTPIV